MNTESKTIYFVRHGTTEQLKAKFFQDPTEPLSEMGRRQARIVAKKLREVPIDVIIASTMARSLETADAISAETGLPLVESEFFTEIVLPSVVCGKARTDPEVVRIVSFLERHFDNSFARHSDEENFYDLRARAVKARNFLEARPEKRIVVVTHAAILTMLFAVMTWGDMLLPDTHKPLKLSMYKSNTGITTFEYNRYGDRLWTLMTWNDHGHLAEIQD